MLRKSDGLTQSQVAQALNIGTQAYSYYERGDREPPLELLCKMADYFNVSVDYLIGHTKAKPLWIDPILQSQRTLFESSESFFRMILSKAMQSCTS